MSIWFRHKTAHPAQPQYPWRTPQGRLYCPGRDCTCIKERGTCDSQCPLWLNTEGLHHLQAGHPDEALPLFNQSLSIAEDCTAARCNRGVCKAMRGHFFDALQDFEAVLATDPTSKPALSGAARAARDAGLRSRAEHWQTCYRARYNDGLLDGLFEGPAEIRLTGDPLLKEFSAEVCAVLNLLLDTGRTAGLISRSGMAPLPDLIAAANPTCMLIAEGLRKRLKNTNTEALDDIIFQTCAYAAAGMVHLWLENPDKLKAGGYYRALSDGFKYVTNLREHIERDLLPTGSRLPNLDAISDICRNLPLRFPGKLPFAVQAVAMYLFGLTLEADALGL